MNGSVRRAVVLGSGTMGAQIAAHLAGCGLDVWLLDQVEEGGDRRALARRALEGLSRFKPSALSLPEDVRRIQTGNFEDDRACIESADWVIEAIVEDLDVKCDLLRRLAPALAPSALLTTNTSGLSISAMAMALPSTLRPRFFGTHFFNPPRYLKLLETIPGPDTDGDRLSAFEGFAARVLGKAVVRAKDTPAFIANRLGMHAIGAALQAMVALDLTIEEVDMLTGRLIGRPKSATFRTADIAGVDICQKVALHLHAVLTSDPERAVFRLPDFVTRMVERRLWGEKTGAGFYRKRGTSIETLDWKTLEYRARQAPRWDIRDEGGDVASRLRSLLSREDPAGLFLWRVLSATCLYGAACVGEIADDMVSIDRAMEWGFGWGLGPIRLLDGLDSRAVAARARKEGRAIPPLVEALLRTDRATFYAWEGDLLRVFTPSGPQTVTPPEGVLDLDAIRRHEGRVRRKNPEASLLDLGDGCGLVEFQSKFNTLGPDALEQLRSVAREAGAHFDALVIGNRGDHFSAGANLALLLAAVQNGRWNEVEQMIESFQDATMGLKYCALPVVAAPFGLTLGGGCEIALHATRVRLAAETYAGLVEAGVGLLPAAGGTKEMALRALDRCRDVERADPLPFLKRAFETIAFAKVSGSGAEAQRLFFTPADSITPHPDRLLGDAKQLALGLARAGHRPARERDDIPALGRPALAFFKMGIHNARRAEQISEHDARIGTHIATVLCGGDRTPGLISEWAMLDLEREAFLSLVGTPQTQERIQFMLKEGKPLRN